LRPTTWRYFFWGDDNQPWCRCPRCRELSDSDQALVFENYLLKALRQRDPKAQLAHLAYANTLSPPARVRPELAVFLEYARSIGVTTSLTEIRSIQVTRMPSRSWTPTSRSFRRRRPRSWNTGWTSRGSHGGGGRLSGYPGGGTCWKPTWQPMRPVESGRSPAS